jgi:tRNA wybutosine-synthesizing protein 1
VIRHTLVRGWNLGWVDRYADLDLVGRPDFIESKGYVYMGKSRQRLGRSHVPSMEDVRRFAHELSRRSGYPILDESPESKVLLLGQRSEGRYLPGLGPGMVEALA